MKISSTYRLTWCVYWLLGVSVVTALIVGEAQASQTAPSIIVDISVLHPSNSSQAGIVFITLSNLGTVPAESLYLSIESINGPVANSSLPSLIGGQSQVVPVAIPPSDVDQLVLILQYRQGDVEQSQVKLIELKSSSNGYSSYLNVLLPAIFGSMITLMSVFVAAFLNERRESTRAKFEWKKSWFEQNEQYYRKFVLRMAGTLDGDQINHYFIQLNESAKVPNHLVTKVMETISVLKSDVSTDQKRIARDNLLNEFEQFMEIVPF